MQNPIEMDDLGIPLFLETPILTFIHSKMQQASECIEYRSTSNLKIAPCFEWNRPCFGANIEVIWVQGIMSCAYSLYFKAWSQIFSQNVGMVSSKWFHQTTHHQKNVEVHPAFLASNWFRKRSFSRAVPFPPTRGQQVKFWNKDLWGDRKSFVNTRLRICSPYNPCMMYGINLPTCSCGLNTQ